MSPTYPRPDPETRAFNLALAERLGLDAEQVLERGFEIEVDDGTANIRWESFATLPESEIHDLLRSAQQAKDGDRP